MSDENNEKFLKEFSKEFYQKIIDVKDFYTFEVTLTDWIKNDIDKKDHERQSIFELMKNHHQTRFWFSSIIGFFYQFGIGCDLDRMKAMEFYLLAINNEIEKDTLNKDFKKLHLITEKKMKIPSIY